MTSSEYENRVHPFKLGHANIYLIKTDSSSNILVDAGMPNKNKQLDEAFQKSKVDPESVQLIILTHGHLDHVGSIAFAQETTGAKILCHKSYANDLTNGKIEPAVSQNLKGRILNFFGGFLGSSIKGVIPDIVVEEEFDLNGFGLPGKVIHTPGHSSSSISIMLDNGELLIGDLIREESPGQVGLGMFYEDKENILESLKKVAAFDPRIIYLSHGTTIDNRVLMDFIESLQ